MAREDRESIATRLYRGDISWDFIGRRRWWYALSGLIMLIGIVSLVVRGINPSIDFKGGAQFQGPLGSHSISDVDSAVASTGIEVQTHQTINGNKFQVQTKTLTQAQVITVESAIVDKLGITNRNDLSISTVGSSWGSQITHKAYEGLIIFMIAVMLYLSIRFEWKMALAAMIALVHDLIITAGIYSLSGLEVSPSTVIALLTILGYSLYDTVVVFDKVRENTVGIAGGSKMTFTQSANLAVNQTLVRSINTSVIALLPVLGLLVIGAGFLGAGSLDDLSVALFIGLASGAYSSIFIATPLLCDFKEREETYQALAKRVSQRRAREVRDGVLTPAVATGPADGYAAALAAAGDVPAATVTGEGFDPNAPLAPGARPRHSQRTRAQGSRPGGRGSKSRKRR